MVKQTTIGALRGREGNTRHGRRTGYTFLELMLVVGLMMALVAMAAPRMAGIFTDSEFTASVRDLVSTMRYARQFAVVSGDGVEMRIDAEAGEFRLMRVELGEEGEVIGEIENVDEDELRLSGDAQRLHKLPEGVRFEVVYTGDLTEDGEPRLLFYPDGSATGGIVGLMNEDDEAVQVEVFRATGMTRVSKGEIELPEVRESDFIGSTL